MTRYVSLAEYLVLADNVLGIGTELLIQATRVELAESALQAPAGEFGGQEFYPDLTDKAAVLVTHLTWNHPLIDGNKRTAWLSLQLFVAFNGGTWRELNTDQVELFMVGIAAHDFDEHAITNWLAHHIHWPTA